MKNIRGFVFGLVIGLAAALATVGVAQDTKPVDQNQKTQSCCAMESCCGHGSSCSMKHEQNSQAHKEHAKQQAGEHSHKDWCCCCGDSCNMKHENEKQG